LVYVGVLVASAVIGGEPLAPPLLAALCPIAVAAVLAWRRRALLRPELAFRRSVAIHLGLGVAYAAASATGSALLVGLVAPGTDTFWDSSVTGLITYLFFLHIILYVILIGFLMWTESINRTQESYALVARAAVLRARAEARALRAQFNPHFVFNVLHSLMMLVREASERAERAIEDVADLIRYAANLEQRNRDTVPLRLELEMVEKYLSLESLRLSDRLAVVRDVAPGLDALAVPSFSIQILVENAIRHGVATRPEGGTVTIRVAREDRHLAVTIEDDGPGAEVADVEQADGRGLGLLARRLDILYGRDGALEWRTAPGRGFAVRVRIPVPAPERNASAAGVASGGRPGPPSEGERIP
jgi:LytS/YehU family sensor histidine kinase